MLLYFSLGYRVRFCFRRNKKRRNNELNVFHAYLFLVELPSNPTANFPDPFQTGETGSMPKPAAEPKPKSNGGAEISVIVSLSSDITNSLFKRFQLCARRVVDFFDHIVIDIGSGFETVGRGPSCAPDGCNRSVRERRDRSDSQIHERT